MIFCSIQRIIGLIDFVFLFFSKTLWIFSSGNFRTEEVCRGMCLTISPVKQALAMLIGKALFVPVYTQKLMSVSVLFFFSMYFLKLLIGT